MVESLTVAAHEFAYSNPSGRSSDCKTIPFDTTSIATEIPLKMRPRLRIYYATTIQLGLKNIILTAEKR